MIGFNLRCVDVEHVTFEKFSGTYELCVSMHNCANLLKNTD
jgi:hypothetical protein